MRVMAIPGSSASPSKRSIPMFCDARVPTVVCRHASHGGSTVHGNISKGRGSVHVFRENSQHASDDGSTIRGNIGKEICIIQVPCEIGRYGLMMARRSVATSAKSVALSISL